MSNERKFKVGDRVRLRDGEEIAGVTAQQRESAGRGGVVAANSGYDPDVRWGDGSVWFVPGEAIELDTAPPTTPTAPDITTCNDCELQYVAATATTWDEGPRDFICPQCCAAARDWEVDGLKRDLGALRKSLDRAADEARRNSGVAKLESPFSPRKVRGDGW